MKKLFTKEVMIGVSVIIALVILLIGIDYLKGINIFKPANFYIANYDNVAGLEISAPVTIDGYKVGQVREINFNYEKPGKIEVILALNKNLKITEDTEARIGSTLMNGAFVELVLGKTDKILPVGSEIKTSVKPDLMNSLSDDLLPSVKDIVPKVDSLLANLNKLCSDPALLKSIQSLEGITGHINHASAALDVTMSRQVPSLMGEASKAVAHINVITSDLESLSGQLKTLPLNATVDNVNLLTENLIKFSEALNNKNSSLGLLTNDPALYDNLNRVSADIDSLILDIKKNPKRYINIKLL